MVSFYIDYLLSVMLCCCVGIFCALLGIGGGELMGPYLLAHHVLPQISSATTSFMSLSSSSSSVLHHFVLGYDYNETVHNT